MTALSAIGASFGKLLPSLAGFRQVIAVELQAHEHTTDIDRPLSIGETMKPEDLAGTPWQEEYSRIAPHPEDWPTRTQQSGGIICRK